MSSLYRSPMLWLASALLLGGLAPAPCLAHESQPGLLELHQLTSDQSQQTWEVVWWAPIYYGRPHPARLELPADWQAVGKLTVQRLASSGLHRQMVRLAPEAMVAVGL